MAGPFYRGKFGQARRGRKTVSLLQQGTFNARAIRLSNWFQLCDNCLDN